MSLFLSDCVLVVLFLICHTLLPHSITSLHSTHLQLDYSAPLQSTCPQLFQSTPSTSNSLLLNTTTPLIISVCISLCFIANFLSVSLHLPPLPLIIFLSLSFLPCLSLSPSFLSSRPLSLPLISSLLYPTCYYPSFSVHKYLGLLVNATNILGDFLLPSHPVEYLPAFPPPLFIIYKVPTACLPA